MSGIVLVDGEAEGEALVLGEPLGFWGGLDPTTGEIADAHHPQHGECATGRILVIPGCRGSTAGSAALAEAIHAGRGPIGIVTGRRDIAITVGALAARAIGSAEVPVVLLEGESYQAIHTGDRLRIDRDGVTRIPAAD